MEDGFRYRSFFWPIILIGIGVIWLLANLGVIAGASLAVLFRLWPLLLIAIGLDIIVGRRSPIVGALIGLALVGAVVLLLIAAPNLGLAADTELKTDRFTEPVGAATSARVDLDLWSSPAHVFALSGSENLIEVEATYTGAILFSASGQQEKTVRLSREFDSFVPFFWLEALGRERLEIGLNPAVPIELNMDGGSGPADLDLSQLQLLALNLDSGSGSIAVTLPESGVEFDADIHSGSGAVSIVAPAGARANLQIESGSGAVAIDISDGAQANLRIESGSGSVTVDVPDDGGVRLEVRDSGSGSVRVPSAYSPIQSGDGDEGVWESPAAAGSAPPVLIVVEDMGSGSIVVR
jgi:hypothetical protein